MGAPRLFAAPDTGSRLLVVFMRGAYDAANLLVPIHSDFYYESRPTIAIARPGADNGALALNSDWGLHPALQDSLLPLYQKKQAAFVAFAGNDDLSRSHFETQNSVELGQPVNGKRDYGSGFLSRLVTQLGENKARPGAFTQQLPLILRGGGDVPNIALTRPAKAAVNDRQRKLIEQLYRDSKLQAQVTDGLDVQGAAAAIQQEMAAASGDAPSPKGLEGEILRVATMMRDRFNIGFVDVGGWDTHAGQGGAKGVLANRLQRLGSALHAYGEAMGPAWRNTVVVVISEFGRTFRENGSKGTDHGHGTAYWVLGGGVNGGRIAGEQITVGPDTLHEKRDYPTLHDYRAILSGLFQRMYGLDQRRLAQVFPGAKPEDLDLL